MMKFLKINQSMTIEIAVPIDDSVDTGPLSEKDAIEIQKDFRAEMEAQAKAAGGKLIDVSVKAEVVEV